MFYPMKFIPIYKDYIWGGRNLEKLGKSLPEGTVAESWELSCHHDGLSVVANGIFKNTIFNDIVKKLGKELLGSKLTKRQTDVFPLLVKFIDASSDLSVQVHPDDDYAASLGFGEYGKEEMWYIIHAEPGAKLVYGLKPHVTAESFKKAIEDGTVESCLNYIDV